MPHPIAAGNRLEGRDCPRWRLRHRLGDVTAGSALDRPALKGYMIGSDEAPVSVQGCAVLPAAGRLGCAPGALGASADEMG